MKVEVWYAVDEDGDQYLSMSWEDEPIKIELDIQAIVINQ